jgi:type I restriction enzyme S subunit
MSSDLSGQLDGSVRRWKRYPAYKDSGIPWVGETPSPWEVRRLKFCLRGIEQGWSPACENRPAELHEWGVLKVGCVNGTAFNPDEQKALPPDLEPIPELEIKPGDVLMSRANTRELLGSASVVGQVRPSP